MCYKDQEMCYKYRKCVIKCITHKYALKPGGGFDSGLERLIQRLGNHCRGIEKPVINCVLIPSCVLSRREFKDNVEFVYEKNDINNHDF